MINRTIIIGIIIINLSSCVTFFSQKEIVELNNEYKEIILLDDKSESVYGLYLNIKGKINNEVEIEWTNGEDEKYFVKKIILSKENNSYVYNADYYTNIIILRIYSKNNEKGQLKIKYYFENINIYK